MAQIEHNHQKKIQAARGENSRVQFKSEFYGRWINVTTWPYDKEGNLRPGFRINW